MTSSSVKNRSSFTLIELLVVLALVAILSVVVVMTLNPAELLKQARDSNRLSDLATINTALNLFSTDVTGGFMGTSTVVYVSIPDNASSTCGSLGLPALPVGYNYNCVTSANLRNTNGTGWIPVNFQQISSNSPISQLPIDPQNTTSTGNYYIYISSGSWKLQSQLESIKYQNTAQTDGGVAIGKFEIGNNISAAPFLDSLMGWWKFDEGVGASTTDSSGWGFTGSLINSPAWSSASECKSTSCLTFNGTNRVNITVDSAYSFPNKQLTFGMWINNKVATGGYPMLKINGGTNDFGFNYIYASDGGMGTWIGSQFQLDNGSTLLNTWYHIYAIYDGSLVKLYRNGVLLKTFSYTGSVPNSATSFGIGCLTSGSGCINGVIDDVRIYNRALSAAEVSALYNATK